jgi:hypothetical protein
MGVFASRTGMSIASLGTALTLLLVSAICEQGRAEDNSRGGCSLSIEEQVSMYASARARQLRWPLDSVEVTESRVRIDAAGASGSAQREQFTDKILDHISVLKTAGAATTPMELSRLIDQPSAALIRDKYRSRIQKMLERGQIYSVRVNWHFRGIKTFETIAVATGEPGVHQHTLLFEPVLDIDGNS